MKYRTLIIGCGNIAGGLDDSEINSNRPPLTHAKAYKKSLNYDVIACIDSNQKNLSKFQKQWSINQGFLSFEEAISKKIQVDIVSICSPTSYREEHLDLALSLNPKLVFCENR